MGVIYEQWIEEDSDDPANQCSHVSIPPPTVAIVRVSPLSFILSDGIVWVYPHQRTLFRQAVCTLVQGARLCELPSHDQENEGISESEQIRRAIRMARTETSGTGRGRARDETHVTEYGPVVRVGNKP